MRYLIIIEIDFHLDGIREDGDPIPLPTATDAWVEIPVAYHKLV